MRRRCHMIRNNLPKPNSARKGAGAMAGPGFRTFIVDMINLGRFIFLIRLGLGKVLLHLGQKLLIAQRFVADEKSDVAVARHEVLSTLKIKVQKDVRDVVEIRRPRFGQYRFSSSSYLVFSTCSITSMVYVFRLGVQIRSILSDLARCQLGAENCLCCFGFQAMGEPIGIGGDSTLGD
jgi:hypothetical protein